MTNILPRQLRSGTVEFGPVAVPDDASRILLKVPRKTAADNAVLANPLTKVEVLIGESLANLNGGGCGFSGGTHVKKLGVEAKETTFLSSPMLPGVGRSFYGRMEISGPPSIIQLDAEFI